MLARGTIRVPAFCGEKQEVINHRVVRSPAWRAEGTRVTVIDKREGQYRIEFADGVTAWVGKFRVALDEVKQ